jgi:hypothetical protein
LKHLSLNLLTNVASYNPKQSMLELRFRIF